MTKLEEKANSPDLSSLLVSSFMVKKLVTIAPDSTIGDAIKKFKDYHVSVAPVASGTRLLGIISEHDLLLLAGSRDLDSLIEYQGTVITIDPQATLKEALILFYAHHVRRLPVVDATRRLVGMVSRIDILNTIVESTEKQ